MNTETYEKLLNELGIPFDWSLEKRASVIEEKYNDALNLLNVAQQKDEKDWIREIEESIEEMGDALEYTRELQKSLSSGLVLDTWDEKDRLEELKGAGKAQPVPANPLPAGKLQRANMELADGNWEKARKLYNAILKEEPGNAQAHLGRFMALRHIRGKEHIMREAEFFTPTIYKNKLFLLAKSFADDTLKKELEDMEKGSHYQYAVKGLQRASDRLKQEGTLGYRVINEFDTQRLAFKRLGDFADSKEKMAFCESMLKKAQEDAEQGDVRAQFTLAEAYRDRGGNRASNEKKAFAWYKKAAEQGHAGAQYQLGRNYFLLME